MLYVALGIVVIVAALLAGAANRLPLASPLLLSAWSWLVVFVSGLLFGRVFYPLTSGAFALWLVWFVVSGTIYFFCASRPPEEREPELRRLPFDYVPILVVLTAWLAWRVWAVGSGGPTKFFFNLRFATTAAGDFESLGGIGWFYPWVYALFVFELVNAHDGNRWRRWLLWLWMMLFAVATMGKLSLLTPVLAWVVVRGNRRPLPLRRLFVVGAGLFGVMLVLHVARSFGGLGFDLGRFLSTYAYSPIVALGYMRDVVDAPFGAHVFRFAYAVQHAVLGGPEPVQVIQDYVAIPTLTNVYTVLQPFVLDFGMVGAACGAAAYGFFFGLLHLLARGHRQLALIVYAGMSVVVVGQFIGEFLFTMFSGHLQFIIAAALFVSVSRRLDRAD